MLIDTCKHREGTENVLGTAIVLHHSAQVAAEQTPKEFCVRVKRIRNLFTPAARTKCENDFGYLRALVLDRRETGRHRNETARSAQALLCTAQQAAPNLVCDDVGAFLTASNLYMGAQQSRFKFLFSTLETKVDRKIFCVPCKREAFGLTDAIEDDMDKADEL